MNGIISQRGSKGRHDLTGCGKLAEIALLSHTGLVRNRNEDNCCYSGWCLPEDHGSTSEPITVRTQSGEGIVSGVFDGLGGEWFGEAASFTAAKVFAEAVIGDVSELQELFHAANDAVTRERVSRKAATMGTTAVVFCLTRNEVLFGNVGDSSGFMYRDKHLTEVTQKDTNRALLDKMGLHNAKPSVTQYLGVDEHGSSLIPHVFSEVLQLGDVFLAASDGLTDEVGPEQIACILDSDNTVSAIASELRDAALANGGNDNITLALCRIVATAERL